MVLPVTFAEGSKILELGAVYAATGKVSGGGRLHLLMSWCCPGRFLGADFSGLVAIEENIIANKIRASNNTSWERKRMRVLGFTAARLFLHIVRPITY